MSHSVTQCNPVIPVLTPLGKGNAHFVRTDEFTVEWQVFQLDTGESWWWDNYLIRSAPSLSDHRTLTSPIKLASHERIELEKRGYKFNGRFKEDTKGA